MMNAEDKLLAINLVDMPYAYVIYDHARAQHVATVKAWMEKHDIILAGRYHDKLYQCNQARNCSFRKIPLNRIVQIR